MCGLYLEFSYDSSLNKERCKKSLDSMLSRGPDSCGEIFLENDRLYLGHRRLSILDLSPAGHQPMHSSSGRFIIIFNGEIYNHLDLREEIQSKKNIIWKGNSDTETICELIENRGFEETVKSLKGMFAICVYDTKDKSVLLARDRFGEKPLYYGELEGNLIVSSTLDFLKYRIDKHNFNISSDAVRSYLEKTFIPQTQCIFKEFNKVQPGNITKIDLATKSTINKMYWSHIDQKRKTNKKENFIEKIESALSISVKRQLISDRPIGSFLSGGIDSSLISALASMHLSKKKLKTFTIGFHEDDYDEAIFAERISEHLGTEHKTLIVKPEMIIDSVQNISEIYDEPFADYSQVPTYILSKLTSEFVTVALSGDGGDELFGGYNRYKYFNYVNIARRLPKIFKIKIEHLTKKVDTEKLDQYFKKVINVDSPGIKIQKAASALLSSNPFEYYLNVTNHGINSSNLSNIPKKEREDLKNYYYQLNAFNNNEKLMLLDFYEYLPSDILVKVDRASMASSLECRAPFLDPDLAREAINLPLKYKIRNGKTKWILREILRKHVPEKLFDRPKKGFGFPLDIWLRNELKDWAESLLFAEFNNKFKIDESYVHSIWKDHLRGKNRFSELWTIIVFNSWMKSRGY